MDVWYRISVLAVLTVLVGQCCASPSKDQKVRTYSNSLRLTRTVRSHVQQLLQRYKEQQFRDKDFVDRHSMLKTLPSVTINYYTWVQMKDMDRLRVASQDLHSFWAHLEAQKKQLEREMSGEPVQRKAAGQRRDRRGHPELPLSLCMMEIQVDLRDLMRQVCSQLTSLMMQEQLSASTRTSTPSAPHPLMQNPSATGSIRPNSPSLSRSVPAERSSPRPGSPLPAMGTTHTTHPVSGLEVLPSSLPQCSSLEGSSLGQTHAATVSLPSTEELSRGTIASSTLTSSSKSSGSSLWIRNLEGYIILRDLERFLGRLARDFTLLRAKQ